MAINNAQDLYYPYRLIRFTHTVEGTEWAFQQFKNKIKCLVCSGQDEEGEFYREIFDEDELEDHINDTNHDDNLEDMFYVTINDEVNSYLDIYHEFWNGFTISLKMHQVYFSPRDVENTCCDLCQIFLSYSETNLWKHINGNTHHSNLSGDYYGPVPWARGIQSPSIYYPFDLLIDVMGITGKNMSLNIQQLDENYFYCLVCHSNINGDFNQLQYHLESDDHKDNIDQECWNVYCYHFEWRRKDYRFQREQVFFKPWSEDTACCKICDNRELNYQGLYNHSNCFTHRNELRKMQVYGRLFTR